MTSHRVDKWRAVFARVRAALMRRGRSSHDADDFVQEAWVRLACYQRDNEVAQPEAFLMRTALNLSIDAYRLRVSHGEEVLVEDVVLIDVAPTAEATLLAKERKERLSYWLGRLTPKTRDIFLSHRLEGMSYKEIAQRHGLSISSVEGHISRAIQQLTTWMEDC
ncbi:MAG: sigma-70 family RNA polymerase sigma factor [Paucibacter sp.]|nr:sigma-70 family RNA polymerase sigma factor [Roseateles sp.]